MGFLTQFQTSMHLTNYINSLEVQLDDIMTEQMDLSQVVYNLESEMSALKGTGSKAVKQLEVRRDELKALESELQLRSQKIQKQLEAAKARQQSADNTLQENIQRSFSYGR